MSNDPEGNIQILKRERGRSVWIDRVANGKTETVKSWTITPWFAFKLLIGIAQPLRHCRGAGRIAIASLKTPPVRSLRIGRIGWCPVVKLRMPFIPGLTALDFLQTDSRDIRRLASELGCHAAKLAESGFRHRDFKLSNVVIQEKTHDVWLIDPVGVVRDRDPARSLACMLERLNVEIEHGLAGDVDDIGFLRRCALRGALRSMAPNPRRAVIRLLRRHPQP
ncbi:MAG: hypothetical protein CMJ40_01935 [Phycisphaerae bacterium]|nr:hypothetical protein [Phycisphaerae bacterium]